MPTFYIKQLRSRVPTVPDSLPIGVTLRAIDGGANYYGDNGFTYAHNAGWDDPATFPIGVFLGRMNNQTDANVWIDQSIRAFWDIDDNNCDLSVCRTNNFYGVIYAGALAHLASIGQTLGVETVGLETFDEPSTEAEASNPITTVACATQNNRVWTVNFTWSWLAGFFPVAQATQMSRLYTTPCATQRHLDHQTIDIYWMAGERGGCNESAYSADRAYGMSIGTMSADQRLRTCHYGDMIDILRTYQAGGGHFPAPLGVYIENGQPFSSASGPTTTLSSTIRSAELNSAVWSTIIHGARCIKYFNHTFSDGNESLDNLANAYYSSAHNGDAVSIYAQSKSTNALVTQMAPVINSSFADGFATVSPAPSGLTDFSGFDLMVKYQNRGTAPLGAPNNKFYLFVMPRYSPTLTNQTATFTIKNTGASQVTVINESRTISITNGGTQFVDTFATSDTVHIYRVD